METRRNAKGPSGHQRRLVHDLLITMYGDVRKLKVKNHYYSVSIRGRVGKRIVHVKGSIRYIVAKFGRRYDQIHLEMSVAS